MIPAMRLNVSPVTTSQPPQSRAAARRASVRGARRVHHSSAPSAINAAGSSHAACPPNSAPKSRVSPVSPQPPAGRATDAADLVAGEPAEAVVAEHELQDAVGLRAADVRTVGGGPELDDQHPPARAHHQRDRGQREIAQPPPPPDGRARSATPPPARAARGTPAASSSGSRTRPASRPAAASGRRRVRPRAASRTPRRPAAASAARRGC